MRRLLLPALLLAAGCHGGDGGGGPTDDGCPPGGCTHVIDRVIVPMLKQNGLPLTVEDAGVLCRRMAIDLTGIAPNPSEIAEVCPGSPAAVADHFMNKATGLNVPDGSPPYVFVNRRWWADQFQYQSGTNGASTYYTYVRALDGIVGDLYSGKIGYDEFARRALASPAFARRFGVFEANHDLVQIASQAFRVFLGREALPSEAEDFGNLWRGWTTKLMDEATSEATYPDCPVQYDQNMMRNGCRHYELGLDGRQCGGTREASCQSTVLGAGEVVPSTTSFVRFDSLAAGDLAALETPGRLIAAQPEFAEAAVDAALTRYLGWWKAGWYRPDFDVPAVRDALVARFVADAYDVRKLDREIVTSVLYTQAAALAPSENPLDPIWAVGPTKMTYAEAWLDTVGQATNKKVGGCDFRFNATNAQRITGWWDFSASANTDNQYATAARSMGGCPQASQHGDPGGLVPAITRRIVLAQLCPGAFKASAGASLGALVDPQFTGIGRSPTSDEKMLIASHMADTASGGCDPSQGKCNLQGLADSLCTSLYASALFTYY
jgi:hypothetical protein